MSKKIILGDHEYELIKNYKDAFDLSLIEEKYTDYFDSFDYIFCDFSYDKIRIKGFYEYNSKLATEINDIKIIENYIKNYCSYECRYFLLKKLKK